MRRQVAAWMLGAACLGGGAAAAQDLAPGLAQVVDDTGARVSDATVICLPGDLPESAALAAFVGTDLVHAARAGTTVMAVGEAVGRIGYVALDLDPRATVHPAPTGVADLWRVPAGDWWVVAGAPGAVPASAVRWQRTDPPTPLSLSVLTARHTLVTFDLTLRWSPEATRSARVTLRLIPMRPERPRRLVYREGDHTIDLAHAGAGPGDAQDVEQLAGSGAVRARITDGDATLLAPVPLKRPFACAISPEVELRVWAGRSVRTGRCGVLRLGDPTARTLLLRPHRAGNARLTLRIVGPDGRPVPRAVCYLFPEGSAGFERQGLGRALTDPVACCEALRAARRRPPSDDLTVAGARAVTLDGTLHFEGLAPGAMRCVVEADGYGQRTAPELDIPEGDDERTATVHLLDLGAHVGVIRVDVRDPVTGPFQGTLHWSVAMPGYTDHGSTVCREDGLTLTVPPGRDVSVHCSSGERGGLAGEARGLTVALGAATAARVRMAPPPGDHKR